MAARLTVDVVSDFNSSGFDKAEGRMSKLGSGLGKFAAAAGGAFAAKEVISGIGKVIGAGSDLQQSIGAIESSFGDASGEIKKFGKDASKNVGLSKSAFNELAAVSGSMLKNLGYNSDEAAKTTEQLSVRAADLAATFGGTTADAMEAVNAALRGETDPLEKFGVKLSQADIKAKAMSMGLADASGAVDKYGLSQAAIQLLMDQSADKAGTFADETNTVAGRMQILKAQASDMAAQLGTAVLPLLERLGTFAANVLVPAIQNVVNWISQFISGLTGAGGAAGSAGGIIDQLRAAWETLAPKIKAVFDWLVQFASKIWDDMQPAIQALAEYITQHVVPGLVSLADAFMTKVWPGIQKVLDALEPLFAFIYGKVIPIVLKLAGPVFDALVKVLSITFTQVGNVLTVFAKLIEIGTSLANVVGGALKGAFSGIKSVIDGVKAAIDGIINAAKTAIDTVSNIASHIPGGGVLSAIGNLFDEPDTADTSSFTVGTDVAQSRMARALSPAAPAPGSLRSRSGHTITVHGALMPQETARQLAQLMGGARVRTGFVGIRP